MTRRYRNALLTPIIVGIVLGAGWLAYHPALSGMFLLDDLSNLGDLQYVDDGASALHFMLSGTAGPTGRPLALATFLVQADQWEQGAGPFLAVNIAIHLLNACLLGFFLYLLSRERGVAAAESRFVGIAAMSLWLFMPLLASSSLMIVQRMTTLSATFILLGLNTYLLARSSRHNGTNRRLWNMSAALVAMTGLAVLTKESGALLPLLVLVVEFTLLSRPAGFSTDVWRVWTGTFLVLPTLLILAYLATRLPYSESLVLRRDFGGMERLLTESQILWEYLLNAFIPRPGRYGPFHDAYPVSSTMSPGAIAAAASWLVIVGLAVAWRKKYPLWAFAVLWFVGGHLLESTTVALELYFEHRNYVPIMGPVYAVCALAVSLPNRYQVVARVGLSLYVTTLAFFLFTLASIYGNPDYATRYWAWNFPDSSRAATTYATRQLQLEGPAATIATLRRFAHENPEDAFIAIPALSLSCIISREEDLREEAAWLESALPTVDFSYQVSNMLSDLLTTIESAACNGADDTVVEALAGAIMKNPRYRNSSAYQQLHHQILALIQRHRGDTDGTLAELEKALAIAPTSELNMMIVTTLVSGERFEQAREFISQARRSKPAHPLKRQLWNLTLEELQVYVDESESADQERSALEKGTIS